MLKSMVRKPAFYLYLIILLYTALLLPTLGRQGISWDEQTDLNITRAYFTRRGWYVGSDIDPSQTRLPMAVVALLYALMDTFSLWVGRYASYAMGVLTIVGVYVYCRRDYDVKRGLLACAILATSPFFLSFARIAFTETDIYLACGFAWLLVCMSILREKRTLGWAAITAVVLGLTLSSKFTAAVIYPAVLVYVISLRRGRQAQEEYISEGRGQVTTILIYIASAIVVLGWTAYYAEEAVYNARWFPLAHFWLVAFFWVLILAWAARYRHDAVEPRELVSFVVTFALITYVVIPPVHLTNLDIMESMVLRFENEMNFSPSFRVEAAFLHLACVVFKSGPLIGLTLLAGFVATLFQWRKRQAVRFPFLLVLCYFGGLVMLPIAQTFYTVPLLPVLAVFGADLWFNLLSKRRRLALALGALAVLLLIVDMGLCYPDYNLNGYQWLGARYLVGRTTLGYRSVAQLTSDGVEQVIEWAKENTTWSDHVLIYVEPWHIVEAVDPSPDYWAVDGRRLTMRRAPEYIICHINYTINDGWGLDDPRGETIFQNSCNVDAWDATYTKVYTVTRAFGLEVATVWKKE